MVKIVCRIKPPSSNNTAVIDDLYIKLLQKKKDMHNDIITTKKTFKLDKIYDTHTSTLDIFENEILPMISNSFFLFLYGHTGTGKTYTLFGNKTNCGIIDMLANEFNYQIEIECIELRHDGSYDLLTSKSVTLLEDIKKNIYYKNLSCKEINNKDEYHDLIERILSKRKTGKSKHNNTSSRTHLIINIYCNCNKYSLIDLAGNERKPSLEKGLSTLQTSYINSSLLALKECFRKYNIKNQHIPFRRSKLTRVLRDLFEKKVPSLIICTIHSGYRYQNDTNDTLFYVSQFHQNFNHPLRKRLLPVIKTKHIKKNTSKNTKSELICLLEVTKINTLTSEQILPPIPKRRPTTEPNISKIFKQDDKRINLESINQLLYKKVINNFIDINNGENIDELIFGTKVTIDLISAKLTKLL